MTNSEFSNGFDVLYNNITSNQAPGLDEYEKSFFLTKAQEDILKAYFDPRGNKFVQGYGDSAKRDVDFSMVIKTVKYNSSAPTISSTIINLDEVNPNTGESMQKETSEIHAPISQGEHYLHSAQFDLHPNSASVHLPNDLLFMINEQVLVSRKPTNNTLPLQVIPINYAEYTRLMSKPFKRPLHYQAWRISNTEGNKAQADLVVGSADTICKYIIRYIRKPNPIILVDLSMDGVSIDGETEAMQCCLDPSLHSEILQRAVELAKAAYIGDLSSQVALGQNSGTNIGIVASGGRNSE